MAASLCTQGHVERVLADDRDGGGAHLDRAAAVMRVAEEQVVFDGVSFTISTMLSGVLARPDALTGAEGTSGHIAQRAVLRERVHRGERVAVLERGVFGPTTPRKAFVSLAWVA